MTHRRLTSSLLAVAVCGAGAAASAGCGSTATIDPVAQAAVKSTGSPGFRLTLSMSITSPALPSPLTATGRGTIDERSHSGSILIDMNLGSSPQVVRALGSSTMHFEERLEKTSLYMKLPSSITSKLGALGGKPWLKLDLAKAASAAGIPGFSSLLSNPASSDPGQLLQYLRAISDGSVTKVGTGSVNGISTTHYRGKVQLDRVPDVFPARSRAAVRQAISGIERLTSLHELPVDVWVDGEQLVRRFAMVFQEKIPTGQTLRTSFTVNILDYGPQPAVAPPAANQVLDLTRSLTGAG